MTTKSINALIVEDDPSSAEALAETLALYDIMTTSLPDAAQALSQIARDQPDVLVVDIWLAGPMTGLDLLTSLRRHVTASQIPAVAISAFMDEQMAYDLRREGFAACFRKPFEIDKIIAVIDDLIPGRAWVER